ncbi:hypothetical protein QCE73_36780 [Caballeronia sp. LZ029]|uniref:hypothetical protein n=1 Tax=Caballeronia sp. LZ029 TaxID=3038564 RepID=UPI0028614056|nr:hypothetical protein [Caballeronia sp. LZ029]MDR5748740.1 hypothetical protein [Caballeronia sp. LZ029]
MDPVSHSFEDLAQSLRILLEAHHRAEREGLIRLDRAEATGNVESAVSGVLNSFHSLFDAMTKARMSKQLDWYKTPELALILLLRNARHHNHARKIRTLYTHYAQEAKRIGSMERYVLMDFPPADDDGDTFDVYLSWGDLRSLLTASSKESGVKEDTAASVKAYLGIERFAEYAAYHEVSEARVMFNVVPLIVNAGRKIAPSLKGKIETRSTEADSFLKLFNVVGQANTLDHEVAGGPIAWA